MELVDEEDDFAVGFLDLFDDGFEAVFEFAAIFCAGEHGAEVEGDEALVAERFRDVAGDDAAGEAFDDGGLADSGLTDEDGIIFRAAAEDLDDAANLLIAADDGIELTFARELGEVFGVALEGLEFCLPDSGR